MKILFSIICALCALQFVLSFLTLAAIGRFTHSIEWLASCIRTNVSTTAMSDDLNQEVHVC